MANAYYDETLFNQFVAGKPTYDYIARKTVATAGHVEPRFVGTVGCMLDNTPGVFEPVAFLLTDEGALPASSPALFDGYFSFSDTGSFPLFSRGLTDTDMTVMAVASCDRTKTPRHNLPASIKNLASLLTVSEGDIFPLIAVDSSGSSDAPPYTRAVFASGSNAPVVTASPGSSSGSSSGSVVSAGPFLKSLVERATGATLSQQVVFGRLEDKYEHPNTPTVQPYSLPLHTRGYAVRGSLTDANHAGVYKLAVSNGRLGVSVGLEVGVTSLEVNGGGYKPFTLPVIDFPLVRFLRVRPLLNPAALDGVSGYRLQIGLLDKITGMTTTVGQLPDSEYSDGRHNIRFQYVSYSDAWGTSQVGTHAADFDLDPVQYGAYSGFSNADILPTAVIKNVSEYHAVMVDVDANVSDLSAIKGIYISVKLDDAFLPTVFVVEASADGTTWESVAELDVYGFEQARLQEASGGSSGYDPYGGSDGSDGSSGSTTTTDDGYTEATRKHLVDVTAARVPSPAIMLLRKGWNL